MYNDDHRHTPACIKMIIPILGIMMIISARIEDMALITRCVASQSLSSTHGAAEPPSYREYFYYVLHFSLIQGVFQVFLAFLHHTESISIISCISPSYREYFKYFLVFLPHTGSISTYHILYFSLLQGLFQVFSAFLPHTGSISSIF